MPLVGHGKQTVQVPELRSQITVIRNAQCVFGQQVVWAGTARPCDLGPAYDEQHGLIGPHPTTVVGERDSCPYFERLLLIDARN